MLIKYPSQLLWCFLPEQRWLMRLVLGDGKGEAAGDAGDRLEDDAERAADERREEVDGVELNAGGKALGDAGDAQDAVELGGGEAGDLALLDGDGGGSGGGEGQGGEGEDHGELHFESGGS
jgi:hypothetical protein